ncbi:MAG: hypothetical protein WCK34_01205 [Bacteroidota bacterium]
MAAGLLSSCATTKVFYQVYKTNYEGLTKKDHLVVFEDENCVVSYNLWGDGGNIGFRFYNKTDQNIFLNLDECFYISNGNAFNYYKNRVYTSSSATGVSQSSGISSSRSVDASVSVTALNYLSLLQTNSVTAGASQSVYSSNSTMSSKGRSVAINEEKIMCIPPQSSKIVAEYSINESPYRDCDLLRFPKNKQSIVKTFDKTNSPYIFSNLLVYKIGQNENQKKIKNEFYVTEISNLTKETMSTLNYERSCGEKSFEKQYFFKNLGPDAFYIEYVRPNTYKWEH